MHVSSNSYLLVCINMTGGRYDQFIVHAFEAMAQALQVHQNEAGDELCRLGKFQRNNPPTFKGRYDPEGAHIWLREIEKIFRVMASTEDQQGLFGTHMLSEEAEDWWDNAHQRMEDEGTEVTWVVFITSFIEKYFSKDVRSKKETEFLVLKQGNSIVA